MLKCNIRYLMAQNKIDSIVELMDKSGASRNSINKLIKEESIETLKIETLIKICDALSCRLSDLIEYGQSKK